MSAKCAICKKAIVSHKGQVCITCQINAQTHENLLPYAENKNIINDTHTTITETNKVTKMPAPSSTTAYTYGYRGSVHNYHQSNEKKSFIRKWWNSCIKGAPFSLSDKQYEFSLYEGDNSGLSGHEVILYGDAGYSPLCDGTEVIVSGKKDNNGIIVATEIKGTNTEFRMHPRNAVPANAIRIITVIVMLLIVGMALWASGIFHMQSETSDIAQSVGGINTAAQTEAAGGSTERILIMIVCGLSGALLLKSRMRRKYLYAALPVLFGLGMYIPVCLLLFVLEIIGLIMFRKK